MRILIACEFSGIVRNEFVRMGHDCMSCDLLPTETPGKHYEGNVLDIMYENWDFIIAHPPCQYLTNTASQFLKNDPDRWAEMIKAAEFFKLFLNHPCGKVVVENPIPNKHTIAAIGGKKYSQIVQPYQFGHPESKRSCFWIKGVQPLIPSVNVKHDFLRLSTKEKNRSNNLPGNKDRWKERSRTLPGIARAMAESWG